MAPNSKNVVESKSKIQETPFSLFPVTVLPNLEM